MSGLALIALMIASWYSSMRCERWSPPYRLAFVAPLSRDSRTKRTALASLKCVFQPIVITDSRSS